VGGDCIEATDSRISLTGAGNTCSLTISRVMVGDRGQYSCVMADREDVQTSVSRNISLDIGVAATVSWVQGSTIQYGEEDTIHLMCQSEGGHPPPTLVIRGSEGVMYQEEPQVSSGGLVSRSVTFDGSKHQNNTELSCHAEQRGQGGLLLYNSSLAIIRLEVLSPLMLVCVEWWCGWELIIFILLVVGLLLLVACCGMYFFFATRGKPYNIVMYDSEENNTMSKQQLLRESASTAGSDSTGLYTNVNKTNKSSYNQTSKYDMNTSTDSRYQHSIQTNNKGRTHIDSSLEQRGDEESRNSESLYRYKQNNIQTLEASKNQTETSISSKQERANIDTSKNERTDHQLISGEYHKSSNSEDITRNQSNTKESSTITAGDGDKRKGYLIEMEEMMSYKTTTQTTVEERYRVRRRQDGSFSDISDSSSIEEDTTVVYPLHQYHLKDCKKIKRLGRSYSKIIKDHLNQNPSIAVSETSIEFKVPRAKSRAAAADDKSCQSSPFLGQKLLKHHEVQTKNQYSHTEETHFN